MKRTAQRHCNRFVFLFSLFSFLFSFASCENMFQEKIPSSGKNDSLDSLFRKQEEITKLQTPQQFYVAQYYSSTEIRLTWTEVRGAAYYMVERAVASPQDLQTPGYQQPDEGEYEVLNRFVYNTSYTDEILKNPSLDAPENQNKYFYRISAFNTAKKYDESDPTAPMSAMLFRAPGNVRASGGTSTESVELRWEPSAGATSYEIFRSEFPSGVSASSLGIVRGNQTTRFNNTVSTAEQGKDFYYMVSAQNGIGNKTLQTRPAYGYARVFGAPDAPDVSLAANSGRGQSASEITIKWNAADEPDAYYAVYRYSNTDSSLTRLIDRTNDTQWSDKTGLKPGVYYYYKVQAIIDDIKSGKALKSQFSSPDPEGFILSPPDTVVAVKNPDGKVTVKWKPAIGSESEFPSYKYNVYADTKIDGNFTTNVSANVIHSTDGEGFISADGLSQSNGVFFRVSTVNSSNVESVKSIVVSPAPAAAVIQGATQHLYFSGTAFAANSNSVYPVKITWKKPADEEPAFYHVQRSTKSGTGFSTINETALSAKGPFNDVYFIDSEGFFTYIDKNESAKVGRKFYYRVLSLNQLEQGNFSSAEAIGWGALTHEQYILEYNKTMGAALKRLTYMHKPGSTEKLGTETKNGAVSGTIYYNAAIQGAGARIIIQLSNYAEFYIENDLTKGPYFILTGNSNTSANMSSNGNMDGTVTCTGMYPGKVIYDGIEIKGGAAGGGTYGVEPEGGGRKSIGYSILN